MRFRTFLFALLFLFASGTPVGEHRAHACSPSCTWLACDGSDCVSQFHCGVCLPGENDMCSDILFPNGCPR